jgi:membrane protease YdiL (CAAX protease family)
MSDAPQSEVFPPPARGWLLVAAPALAIALAIGLIYAANRFGVYWAEEHNRVVDYVALMAQIRKLPQRELVFGAYVYTVFLFALWLLIPKRGAQALRVYLRGVGAGRLVGGFAVGVAGAITIIAIQIVLQQQQIVTFHETDAERALAARSLSELPLTLFLASVLAPLVEEIYFRGLLLGWLRRRLNVVVAALISATVFALVHGYYVLHHGLEGWVITALIGLVGLMLTVLAVTARSLWPSIAGHCGYNGTLMVLPFLAPLVAS